MPPSCETARWLLGVCISLTISIFGSNCQYFFFILSIPIQLSFLGWWVGSQIWRSHFWRRLILWCERSEDGKTNLAYQLSKGKLISFQTSFVTV